MNNWEYEIRQRITHLKLAPEREAEIVEELAQHMNDRYAESIAAGHTEEVARLAALAELQESGLLSRQLELSEKQVDLDPSVLGATGPRIILSGLTRDVRFGLRSLLKNPMFSIVAIATIAIGIGVNVLIFTLVERILLSGLPYPEPDRIVNILQSYPEIGLQTWGVSPANFARYRDNTRSFESIAAYQASAATLTGLDQAEYLQAGRVTADFFKVLGVNPVLGRTFITGDDSKEKKNLVVLSHVLWQRRFGGDPNIVGKSIVIGDVPTEVIGVMPAGFQFPNSRTELWLPIALDPERTSPFLMLGIARLKPGVSISAAATDATSVLWNAALENPQVVTRKIPPPADAGLKTLVIPLKQRIVGRIEKPLLILQIAVVFVLLIACANVANLLLSRATKRTQEIALRLALGASRTRIVRQLLTESLLLAFIGAAAGIAFAWFMLRSITQTYSQSIPRIDEATISKTVLLVAVALTGLTGMLFGLVPAFRAYRLGVKTGIGEGQKGSAGIANRRLNSVLVAVQLALSLTLLIGAGLIMKSFQKLTTVTPGFNENTLSMILPVSMMKYEKADEALMFYQKLLHEVRSLPGVNGAGVSSNIPFSGRSEVDGHIVEGQEPRNDEAPQAQIKVVSPGYFKAMGMTLRQGRDFMESDMNFEEENRRSEGMPLVAVINETMARQYWPNGDAIGRRIRTLDPEWFTVIGVVSDVKEQNLSDDEQPHIYFSYRQGRFSYGVGRDQRRFYLVVNTHNPGGTVPMIRQLVNAIDRDVPIHSINTMGELVTKRLDSQRLIKLLLTSFSVVALLLAAIGTYGVMSLSVSSRTPEFAIRLALGAQPRRLLTSVLKQGFWLAAIGSVAGLFGAWALTRAIASQLFEVSATDPLVFVITPIILIAAAVLASFVPAGRAARTDPAKVLRSQ